MTRSSGKSKVTVRVAADDVVGGGKLQLLIEPTPARWRTTSQNCEATDVVEVVDADDGQAGRLAGGVGGLDAGVERDPELDEAEQEEDQQGKEERELDRGRTVLSPLSHRAGSGPRRRRQSGRGPLARQSPTSLYLVLTALNSA